MEIRHQGGPKREVPWPMGIEEQLNSKMHYLQPVSGFVKLGVFIIRLLTITVTVEHKIMQPTTGMLLTYYCLYWAGTYTANNTYTELVSWRLADIVQQMGDVFAVLLNAVHVFVNEFQDPGCRDNDNGAFIVRKCGAYDASKATSIPGRRDTPQSA